MSRKVLPQSFHVPSLKSMAKIVSEQMDERQRKRDNVQMDDPLQRLTFVIAREPRTMAGRQTMC